MFRKMKGFDLSAAYFFRIFFPVCPGGLQSMTTVHKTRRELRVETDSDFNRCVELVLSEQNLSKLFTADTQSRAHRTSTETFGKARKYCWLKAT